MYLKNKGCALIEYEKIEFATISKEFLNSMKFLTNYLRVYINLKEIWDLRNMCLIKYSTIEETFLCIAYLNNQNIVGRLIFI